MFFFLTREDFVNRKMITYDFHHIILINRELICFSN